MLQDKFYDYKNQAWVVRGQYARCNHPNAGELTPLGEVFDGCECYGRLHEGETYYDFDTEELADTAKMFEEES